MSITLWILLMMSSKDIKQDGALVTRTEATYLAFYTEAECEERKKAFIIDRIEADAKAKRIERSFSAACSQITVNAQK